jgi:6-hydroxynicotinate reductase
MRYVMPLHEALAGKTGVQNDHVLKGRKAVAQKTDWPTEQRHFGWDKT